MPRLPFQDWPARHGQLEPEEVIRLYEQGFMGAKPTSPELKREFRDLTKELNGTADSTIIAKANGWAGSGEGKLVIPFIHTLKVFPDSLPGPAQQRGDCFVAGTMVLGERTMPIEQVEIGDVVWTGEGRLTKVISTRRILSNRPVVRIRPVGGLPITCTEDHKILVYRMARVSGKRVNRAYYERSKARHGGQTHKDAGRAVETCYESRRPEWVRAGELRDTDCLLTPVGFEAMAIPSGPGDLAKTEEGLYLLGYFLGDGHASGHGVELMAATVETAERLEATLRSHGFKPHRSSQKGCWRVRISSTKLVKWLRSHFYDASKVKAFPGWAVGRRAFLEGLQSADGFKKGDANYLDSTSRSIIDGAHASLVAMGFEPAVSQSVRSQGSFENAKPIYRVIWRDEKRKQYVWRDEAFVCRPIRTVEMIEGPTVVYDIGVADSHHSFVANGYAVSNCVSHGTKNAVLVTLACEIAAGQPDEVTGILEGAPELSQEGIRQGVISSEYLYWQRGYNGDGWYCPAAAKCVIQNGILLKTSYPELDIDLTKYSGSLAGKYGSRKPPAAVLEEGRKHLVRTSTMLRSFEEIRDYLHNGYGVSSCGGEGFSSSRDENGVSKRQGSWAHAMAYIGADDRDEIKQKYGGPLVLVQNSWGRWNNGSKKILGTDIEIPDGSFWARWKDLSRREAIALSSVAGWPARDLPDHLLI